MKNIFAKHGVLKCIGAIMDILAIVLLIVAAFVNDTDADMIIKLIGMALFVIGGLIMAIKSDEHQLVKSVLVIIATAVIATWVFPYGYFSGTDFYEYGMSRLGFADFGYAMYYAINFIMDKIVFLILVTGFYGVLSKIPGYQRLTDNLASVCSKRPEVFTVIVSVILFCITSLFSQTIMVLLFIPFFVTILTKMGMDKLTAFAITFGSALVGILGCTYGTDSLTAFNYYIGIDVTSENVGLMYRFIVAGVALVLYNFFLVMRVRKISKDMKKNAKNSDISDDPFRVEKYKGKKKAQPIPVGIVLGLLTIIVILGYVDWSSNFGITVFTTFHKFLTELAIGEDFTIISYILGANANAFGEFSFVFTIGGLLLLVSALLAFLYRMKIDEYFEAFYEGLKRMFKPLLFISCAYIVFGICYLTPIVPTIANYVLNLVEGFNPYLTTLMAFVTSLFQSDLGYTAYTVGGFVASVYAENIDVVHTIFVTMYGLVQVCMPTSVLLLIGLSMMKVNYKDWLKYIWLFVVGMIIILLVLFTVVTYF